MAGGSCSEGAGPLSAPVHREFLVDANIFGVRVLLVQGRRALFGRSVVAGPPLKVARRTGARVQLVSDSAPASGQRATAILTARQSLSTAN